MSPTFVIARLVRATQFLPPSDRKWVARMKRAMTRMDRLGLSEKFRGPAELRRNICRRGGRKLHPQPQSIDSCNQGCRQRPGRFGRDALAQLGAVLDAEDHR